MYCKKCGTDIGDAKFCPSCGEKAPAEVAPKQEFSGRTVNKIAYGIIAILIGGLGIHRFYAGRWLSGIMYLLFCWTCIPSLLGLIEGIIALTRPDDGYGNIPVRDGEYFV